MMYRNIMLGSLKETFTLLWKNKVLFLLLFILQIIFFSFFSFITLNYQTKILENSKAIADYINKQKLDEISIAQNILQQKNILGDDPLSISRNFTYIKNNFRLYLIYTFILLVFFMSASWAITNRIIHKSGFRKSAKYFFRIFIVLLIYLGLIFSFFFSLLNISFADVAIDSTEFFIKYIVFFLVSMVLIYFMFVSISLLNNTELKELIQKTLVIGIRKVNYIISVYIINIFLFAAAAFLLLYFIDENLLVLFLSLLLMIFSFVFGRLFMMNVVGKLNKD